MKAVKRICAFLIGLVFFVAGFLKLMDPVGAGLVVEEYFKFLHLGFMIPLSKAVGVGMALLETLLGTALLAGVFPHFVGAVTGIVLLAFTALTLVLWIVNPIMDCGCFGEAVHLTHFQSFAKNVALCILWLVAFVPFRYIERPKNVKYVSFSIAALSVIAFTIFSLMSIPAIDFTAFKPGATLLQAETVPTNDSPLLSICDASGEYRDELLAKGNLMIITAYDYDKLTDSAKEGIEEYRKANGALLVVGSGEVPEGAYTADRRTLMTINRSNGGATMLFDGLIVAKWPRGKYPESFELSELAKMDPTEAMIKENTPRRLKLQGFLLYVTAVLLLL